MSRQRLEEHRRIWAKKPVLSDVYGVWFNEILAAVPIGGRVLEVGAGPGFLSAYARRHSSRDFWIATDVIEAPWNDMVADGLRLPLRGGTLQAIVGLDLVHHLARPAAFFTEAARVLSPGGRVVMVEPWVTPFSYPIYRFLHQEGCTLGLDPWNPFALREGEYKDAFQGDAAVARRLARGTPASHWRDLGFEPPRVRILNCFAYLLSLGFKEGTLLPRRAAPLFLRLDRLLRAAGPALGVRALLVWDRRA